MSKILDKKLILKAEQAVFPFYTEGSETRMKFNQIDVEITKNKVFLKFIYDDEVLYITEVFGSPPVLGEIISILGIEGSMGIDLTGNDYV